MTTLNEWAHKCHTSATEHGFWETNGAFLRLIAEFGGKDKKQLSDDLEGMMVGQRLALIHSEVSEALEAHRLGSFGAKSKEGGKGSCHTFEDEIVDILIRVFDLAGHMGIDLDEQAEWKYQYNLGRPHKHGKAY